MAINPHRSFQILRGKAHELLEEVFPSKPKRYAWLLRHFPKIHMSQMTKEELEKIIAFLETKKRTGHCPEHQKSSSWQPKQK